MIEAKQKWQLQFSVVTLALLTWMVLTLPIPELPFLTHVFQTSEQTIKLTVALSLFAFGISQLMWGVLSDRYGRRPILIISLTISLTGILITLCAGTITTYAIGIFITSFCFGSASCLARAPLADQFDRNDIIKTYAWIAIATTLAPFLANFLGAYINLHFGWRFVFAFMWILVTLYLAASLYWYHETNENPICHLTMRYVLNAVGTLIKLPAFWHYTLLYSITAGFMIAYYTSLPYWYFMQFHIPTELVAWLSLPPIAAYILGSRVLARKIKTIDPDDILLKCILGIQVLMALQIIIALTTTPNVAVITGLITLFSFATGFIMPLSNSALAYRLPHHIGILPSLMSGIRCIVAAIMAPITANIMFHTYIPMTIYTVIVSLALLFVCLKIQPKEAKA